MYNDAMKHFLFSSLLHFVYPNRCLLCHERLPAERKESICTACAREFFAAGPLPLRRTPEESSCGWAAAEYSPAVRRLIGRFKFNGRYSLARPMASLMLLSLRRGPLAPPIGYDAVSWIPVSPLRLWTRGYDQSRLLAREFARMLGLPLLRTLRKHRHNRKQSTLDAEARMKNVSGVYTLHRRADVRGKRILLLDDIFTTGATMREALAVLQNAGANPQGVTFARASLRRQARK